MKEVTQIRLGIVGSKSLAIDPGHFISYPERIVGILTGGARGIDRMAEKYAHENNIPIRILCPGTNGMGISSILEAADEMLIIWDGQSKTTKLIADLAWNMRKPMRIVEVRVRAERSNPTF
jgi:hypothetical protein